MKIDQDLIKQVLQIMEEHTGHQISNFQIMAKTDTGMAVTIQDKASSKIIDQQKFNNFVGHIRYMYGQGLIDCNNTNSGVAEHMQGYSLFEIEYRLTSYGHSYLEGLKSAGALSGLRCWVFGFVKKIGAHLENHLASAIASLIVLSVAAYFGWEWFSK